MNDGFGIFADAVKTIVEYICTHQKDYGVRAYEELKKHEAVKRCIDFMLQQEFCKKVERVTEIKVVGTEDNPPDYRHFLFIQVLLRLTYEYTKEFGCEFTEQKFKILFDEMITYLHSEVIEVTILENFELKGAEEVLIDKYRIRKLDEWEKEQLMRLGHIEELGIMIGPPLIFTQNLWCIEVKYDVQKKDLHGLGSDIGEFIKVMRLFKGGSVSRGDTLRYSKARNRFSLNSAAWKGIQISVPRSAYVLKQDEVNSLSQLWELYNRVKDKLPGQLELSLRWFEKSYEEFEVEDKILDLDIAFDAIFSGYNYSNYVRNLRRLKDARNGIVHYQHGKLQPNELEAIATEAEEIFRKCYKWFLELIDNKKNYEEIIKEEKHPPCS